MSQEARAKLEVKKLGFRIHRSVYMCVIPMLAIINIVTVPDFLWFMFPMAGWGIGLSMHYLFGIRRLAESIKTE